jgi:capsular polysaccharide biosynthesis protein
MQLNLAQKNEVYPRHENIFVVRRNRGRGVVNFSGLENFLSKSGFFVIDPASLNYREQVSLFSSAKRVIMLGGAAMANIVFMKEGSKLLTIQSQFLHNFRVAQDLSEIFSIQHDYFFGTELFSNKFLTDIYERSHKSYKIDLNRFSDFVLDWF